MLSIHCLTAFAAQTVVSESAIAFKSPQSTTSTIATSHATASSPVATSSNLDSADNSAQDSIKLSRELDIAKKKAELRKIQNGGQDSIGAGSSAMGNSSSQTVVTGVAIDVDGKRFATLQFADGGVLDVSLGSRVGNYVVSDIKMTGVTLKPTVKKGQAVFLKRSYSLAIKPTQQGANAQVNNSGFSPSPVLTSANSDGDNSSRTIIPPILPTN